MESDHDIADVLADLSKSLLLGGGIERLVLMQQVTNAR